MVAGALGKPIGVRPPKQVEADPVGDTLMTIPRSRVPRSLLEMKARQGFMAAEIANTLPQFDSAGKPLSKDEQRKVFRRRLRDRYNDRVRESKSGANLWLDG